MAVNLAELAFAQWEAEQEAEIQKAIVMARNYYNGDHDTFLTERLQEFLGADENSKFNLNVCRLVVGAVEERLILTGVSSTEEKEAPTATPAVPGATDNTVSVSVKQPMAAWADALFEANGLDVLQDVVHTGALVDGQYFVIVDWDTEKGHARFSPHYRYTDSSVEGDGFGCKAHYQDNDASKTLLYVSKRWIETTKITDGKRETRSRMTLYFPERIEKYEGVGESWRPVSDMPAPGEPAEPWPIPWLDIEGKPRGIAAKHFKNTPDLRSELWDAIPLQMGINKGVIDLLAAGDMTAFQILVAIGWIPTSDGKAPAADGSNKATFQPGMIIGTTNADASMTAIPGADLGPLTDMIQSLIGWLAVVSSTPASRLKSGKQISSEGSLQEQNEGLFAKVRKRQNLFNAAWLECFDLALKLTNIYGNVQLPPEPTLFMQWEAIQARDTAAEREEFKMKMEMGVPRTTLWSEMGYSPEEIEQMKATPEYQAYINMMSLGLQTQDAEEQE